MIIGFTGTHTGMTAAQKKKLLEILQESKTPYGLDILHHGDCVGADSEAHDIAKRAGYQVFVHPPNDPKLQAHRLGDFNYPKREYLRRDRDIVDSSDKLIAAPETMKERIRGSGTWYTVRYARKVYRPVIILEP